MTAADHEHCRPPPSSHPPDAWAEVRPPAFPLADARDLRRERPALFEEPSGRVVREPIDLVGPRYADFANTYRVETYGLLGVRAGLTAGRWEIFAEGRNLLDQEYIAALVVKGRAAADGEMLFPGAPRAAYVGARMQF